MAKRTVTKEDLQAAIMQYRAEHPGAAAAIERFLSNPFEDVVLTVLEDNAELRALLKATEEAVDAQHLIRIIVGIVGGVLQRAIPLLFA